MTKKWTIPAIVAVFMVAGGSAVSAADHYTDPVGDAGGSAPDIVACTLSESEDGPLVTISVEFAEEPPLETYTDVVFIDLAADSDPELSDEDNTDYIVGVHAVGLPLLLDSGRICTMPRDSATCTYTSWMSLSRAPR